MQRHFMIAVLAAALVTPAHAQTIDARLVARVREADSNGDKRVTRQEFLAYRANQFRRLDRNRDGVLSSRDAPRFAGRSPLGLDIDAMTTQFDANHDGVVSQAEFANGPTPAFDLCDADHNQVVTFAEIEAAREQRR